MKFLKRLRGNRDTPDAGLTIDLTGQAASDCIGKQLSDDAPCMIGRFGSNELDAALRVFYQRQNESSLERFRHYVRTDSGVYWWDKSIRRRMGLVAGFFPCNDQSLSRFGDLLLDDASQLDILGSWQKDEIRVRHLFPSAKIVGLIDLEPYRHQGPWSSVLAGRKVLVVHPFVETIQSQYKRRENLFENPEVLPKFDLQTYKAVQSNGKQGVEFANWFDALESMCEGIEKLDFDIAIIGAGAYGFSLAAFVKRLGKKSVHLGGATQLLFGIKGRRWDQSCQSLYNDHWTRPSTSETPPRSDLVEGHAYW